MIVCIRNYTLEPKVMEVDGSDDFPDFNWVAIFRFKTLICRSAIIKNDESPFCYFSGAKP